MKEVVAGLNIIANRLKTIVVADCPADATNENLIGFVSDCASERVYAIYPQVVNTKSAGVPASPYVGDFSKNQNAQESFTRSF